MDDGGYKWNVIFSLKTFFLLKIDKSGSLRKNTVIFYSSF